jgi:8-oxo-dGTP pyrophosphatase MutT (NUDIX family)
MIRRDEALLQELRKYEPRDMDEAEHCARLVDLLEVSEDAFSRREYLPGHVTASCFIVDDEARLLLHHHRRLDRWLQMGGHVEQHESPLAAAMREASEESGLRDLDLLQRGIADVDVHEIPAGRGEPRHLHFDVRYLAKTRDPEAIMIDPGQSRDIVWVDLWRAAQLMTGPESVRVLRKIEALLCRS